MSDMRIEESRRSEKGIRSKKLSTHIDMTPMVDVAFLLITFFMLTTTLQRAKTMNLFLPHDVENKDQQNKVKESQALTIIMDKDNELFYYFGIGADAAKDPVNNIIKTNYNLKGGIGDVISEKWKSVIQNSGGRDSMVVIIKPTKEASYENVVSILDDMNIYEVKKYALVPASDNDKKMIDLKVQASGAAPAQGGAQ